MPPSVKVKHVKLKGGEEGISFDKYNKENKEHNDKIVASSLKDHTVNRI